MTARILADGTDATVAVVWVVFVVLLVIVIAFGVLALRRYNANKRTLRSEGMGPLAATAQRLGAYADRSAGTKDEAGPDAPPTGPGDVQERLSEITDLHDRGILDDDEFERQRARMLEP
jgi:Short C-terminal domain